MNDKCISDKEKEYFNEKLSQVTYKPDCFKLMLSEDTFLCGAILGENSKTPFGKFLQYKTLYDTVVDLDWKIKLSLKNAIKYAYLESLENISYSLETENEDEKMVYYYIENAIFRTSSLWDLLAQFYRLFYDLDVPKERIYYKTFFNPKEDTNNKFEAKAKEIYDYLLEEDVTDIEGEWKGNHSFVNEIRNKMTHRNSPNITAMNDYDFSIKYPPVFLIKRIIDDYVRVSKYLKEIIDKAEESYNS